MRPAAWSAEDQESELTELWQKKELLSQWEKQIAEIIQWVTEEDDRWVKLCLGERGFY